MYDLSQSADNLVHILNENQVCRLKSSHSDTSCSSSIPEQCFNSSSKMDDSALLKQLSKYMTSIEVTASCEGNSVPEEMSIFNKKRREN